MWLFLRKYLRVKDDHFEGSLEGLIIVLEYHFNSFRTLFLKFYVARYYAGRIFSAIRNLCVRCGKFPLKLQAEKSEETTFRDDRSDTGIRVLSVFFYSASILRGNFFLDEIDLTMLLNNERKMTNYFMRQGYKL